MKGENKKHEKEKKYKLNKFFVVYEARTSQTQERGNHSKKPFNNWIP